MIWSVIVEYRPHFTFVHYKSASCFEEHIKKKNEIFFTEMNFTKAFFSCCCTLAKLDMGIAQCNFILQRYCFSGLVLHLGFFLILKYLGK
jgi:hypothetical protein